MVLLAFKGNRANAMEFNIIMNWLLPVTRGKDLPVGTSLQLKWATQA